MEEITKENKQTADKAATQPAVPEVKIDPYKVYREDFLLTDKNIIDFYKYRYIFMACKNNLVGRFTSKGNYAISSEVKADLVRMPKEIEDMGTDFYKASNVYMKKHFFFDIKLVMLENKKAKASLYLTENLGVYYSDPHITTHIADFVDDYDSEYKIKLRKAFNLLDIAIPVNDIFVPELAVVMQDNYDFLLINEDLFEMINKVYVLKMLELLRKAGEKGQEIIGRYEEIVSQSQAELEGAKFKNNVLKAILDRVIDEKGGIEKLPIPKEQTISVIQEINKSIKTIVEPQKSTSGVEAMNTKTKSENQSSGSGSSKSKSSNKPKVKNGTAKSKPKKALSNTKGSKSEEYDFSWDESDNSSGLSSSSSSGFSLFGSIDSGEVPKGSFGTSRGDSYIDKSDENKDDEERVIDLDDPDQMFTPDNVYGDKDKMLNEEEVEDKGSSLDAKNELLKEETSDKPKELLAETENE